MIARRYVALTALAVGVVLAVIGTQLHGWTSLAVLIVGVGLVADVLIQAMRPGPVATPVTVPVEDRPLD